MRDTCFLSNSKEEESFLNNSYKNFALVYRRLELYRLLNSSRDIRFRSEQDLMLSLMYQLTIFQILMPKLDNLQTVKILLE